MFSNKYNLPKWALIIAFGFFLDGCSGGEMQSSADSTKMATNDSNNNPPSGGPQQPIPPPPAGNGSYKVYPSCELPATSFLRDVYVDIVNGLDLVGRGTASSPYKTLGYLLNNKLIQAGDHIIIQSGIYPTLNINQTNAPALVSALTWTWFDFKSGAQIAGLSISQIKRGLFTGATITKNTGNIVSLSGTDEVVVADNAIYSSSASPSTLTATQWMALGTAVYVRDGLCNSIYRNQIRTVRFGITMTTAKTTYPNNSMKGLVEENDLRGFSADASRGIGSDLAFLNNTFIDGYVSAAAGDANHDDMFQGYALNGAIFENLHIEGNYMLDRSSSSRNLASDYQGISIFDGLYRNVIVRRNIVISGAYHGISMYGLESVLIEYNTVASTSGKTFWIGLFNSKTGVAPVNNIVQNNLAHQFTGMAMATTANNNIVITNPSVNYVGYDLMNGVFDMHLRTTSPAFGRGAGAL